MLTLRAILFTELPIRFSRRRRQLAWRRSGGTQPRVLWACHQAGVGSLGLVCRTGRRLAPGVGSEAGGAGRVVSSRRKTSRAVITRTIIDGTVDMRNSSYVFYGKLAAGLTGTPLIGSRPNPLSYCFTHRSTNPDIPHDRYWTRDVGLGISSKLRRHLIQRIMNSWCGTCATLRAFHSEALSEAASNTGSAPIIGQRGHRIMTGTSSGDRVGNGQGPSPAWRHLLERSRQRRPES